MEQQAEKKIMKREKEAGKQYQETGRPGVCKVPQGSGEQRTMAEAGCEVVHGEGLGEGEGEGDGWSLIR